MARLVLSSDASQSTELYVIPIEAGSFRLLLDFVPIDG